MQAKFAAMRHRHAQILLELADTEVHVAETFSRLAAQGHPDERQRRAELAARARQGAATALRNAEQLEARLRR